MRYLSLREVVEIHSHLIGRSHSNHGVRDLGALESAVAQSSMSFGNSDLYPTVIEKAAALMFSLIRNHPFLDGNKRVAHASAEIFLLLNGFEIQASVDEQERMVLALASGVVGRQELRDWLSRVTVPSAS